VTRRLISLIAASMLVFTLLPGGIAAAAVNASATLSKLNVFPGDGQDFRLTVRNGASQGFGGFFGAGDDIDAIRIILPTSLGFTLAQDPVVSGWKVTRSGSRITLTEGALRPGQNLPLDLKLDVARPFDRDMPGRFVVGVSDDGGATFSEATGALTSVIRILQILPTSQVSAPAGAADGTASAGQTVTYDVAVKNHAQSEVPVQTTLEVEDGTAGAAAPVSIPAGEERSGQHSVTFDERGSDGDVAFTPGATKASGPGTAVAVLDDLELTHHIQVPPALLLDSGTFTPTFLKRDPESGEIDGTIFEGDFEKVNNPSLRILETLGGERSTFAVAGNVIDIDGQTAFGSSLDPAESRKQTVKTVVANDLNILDGDHEGTYTFQVRDGNDYEYQLVPAQRPRITVDGLVPRLLNVLIGFPTDGDGDQQVRVKGGDRVTVTGEVHDRNPDPEGVKVTLMSEGEELPFDVSTSVNGAGDVLTFTATLEDDFAFVEDDATFEVDVEVSDLAGHQDSLTLTDNPYLEGEDLEIDNFAPIVHPTLPAHLVERDGTYFIEFFFKENFVVKGACNPLSYLVDGELLVRNVTYNDGSSCREGQGSPDGSNTRLLELHDQTLNGLLGRAKDRGWTGNVVYNPSGLLGDITGRATLLDTGIAPIDSLRSRGKDGAGAFALEGVQAIIDQILPPLPDLVRVNRNTYLRDENDQILPPQRRAPQQDWETATRTDEPEGPTYWTRFGGDDLSVTIAGEGIRVGDRLQVIAPGGTLRSDPATDDNQSLSSFVNLGAAPANASGVVEIGLQLLSGTNMEGPIRTVRIVIDTVPLEIDRIRPGNGNELVDVLFNKAVHSGSNFAINFAAWEEWDDNGTIKEQEILVRSVSGTGDVRTLEVSRLDLGPVAKVAYTPESGSRYVDRAGNRLTGTVGTR
jgi:hypothetical protein